MPIDKLINYILLLIGKVKGIKASEIEIYDYLAEDLEMDDIDIDEMIADIETRFDIIISDYYDPYIHLTVCDIVNLVRLQK